MITVSIARQSVYIVLTQATLSVKKKSAMDIFSGNWSKFFGNIGRGISRLYSSATGYEQQHFAVAVEGNIGSGKTRLLKHFENCPYAEVVDEPVAQWRNVRGHNALAKMYEDPERWSLTFQTYVQLTMIQRHAKPQTRPVKLMERSLYSAKYCFVENLFKSGKMPELEYIVLSRWFDWLVENENTKLDLIVYLRASPETVAERIRQRQRKEEQTISMEYLQALHDLHEDWLLKQTFPLPAPVLVLDANKGQVEMIEQYEKHSHKILCGQS